MALGAFGVKFGNMEEVYDLCEAIGQVHYTLPWGMCLGVVKKKLHATFISKNPDGLNSGSRQDFHERTGLTIHEVEDIETDQIRRCTFPLNKIHITILKWVDKFESLPKDIVSSGQGVCIPTVRSTVLWGWQCHNIVLTKFQPKTVLYHDPNSGPNCKMDKKTFYGIRFNENTDNDLLVVSEGELNI